MLRRRSSTDYHASVCTLMPPGDLHRELARIGIPAYSLNVTSPNTWPRAAISLMRMLKRGRFDVVHTHLLHASAAGLVAARIAGSPVVVMTRHYANHIRWYGSLQEKALDRLTLTTAKRIFAVSKAVRDELVTFERVPPGKVEVISNGIDVEHVRMAAAAHHAPQRSSRTLLGSIGSLEPRKDHAATIHALHLLREQGIPAELLLIGAGSLRDDLQQLARRLAAQVNFTGYTPDPYAMLSEVDVYVQSSVEEGLGLAVLEAMAMSKPVVATKVGGLPEIVADGETGLLVEPGNPAALAAALAILLRDAELRRRMGEAGQARVASKFLASASAANYARAYDACLASEARSIPARRAPGTDQHRQLFGKQALSCKLLGRLLRSPRF
jgi:glycosyltransferase involved in cell wall biosynthesis